MYILYYSVIEFSVGKLTVLAKNDRGTPTIQTLFFNNEIFCPDDDCSIAVETVDVTIFIEK